MSRDRRDRNTPPSNLASIVRGLYGRVARQLRLDPSYVSRVARGERKSAAIESALEREMRRILASMVKGSGRAVPKKKRTSARKASRQAA